MEYSRSVATLLIALWAIGSLLLAWYVHPGAYVYFGSVALSATVIIYSILGFGLLPTAGIIHAVLAGVYALVIRYVFQRFRSRKQAFTMLADCPPPTVVSLPDPARVSPTVPPG